MALPTGDMLRAGRALAGLRVVQLAKMAGVDPSTLTRMEGSRHKPTRGQAPKVEAVIQALRRRGVVFLDSGVQLVKEPRG